MVNIGILRIASGALVLVLATVLGCTTPAEVGEPCTDSADCVEELSCIELMHEGTNVCMPDCDLTTTRLCPDGAVCTPIVSTGRPPELGACYLGGTTALGSPCAFNRECVRGAVCIITGGGTEGICRPACSTEGTDCDASEVCTPLTESGTEGFCEPAP